MVGNPLTKPRSGPRRPCPVQPERLHPKTCLRASGGVRAKADGAAILITRQSLSTFLSGNVRHAASRNAAKGDGPHWVDEEVKAGPGWTEHRRTRDHDPHFGTGKKKPGCNWFHPFLSTHSNRSASHMRLSKNSGRVSLCLSKVHHSDTAAAPIRSPNSARRTASASPLFYKLRAKGEAPDIMKAGARTLISVEAADRWRRDRERATRQLKKQNAS